MKLFRRQSWYTRGLAFECIRCGKCCAGPEEGYVWVSNPEILNISLALGMKDPEFRAKYVRKIGEHFSLTEDPNTKDCIFLYYEEGKARCKVYNARPGQCRAWPFWRANLADVDCWCQAAQRCPGVNKGPVHPLTEIEKRQSWSKA